MNLADRLQAVRGGPAGSASTPAVPAAGVTAVPAPRPVTAPAPPPPTDALAKLKDRVGKALFERMGSRMNDPSLGEDALRTIVLSELDEVVEEENVPLSTGERQRLTAELADDVLGYGPLQRLLDDNAVTEIMVNGPDSIYVERGGKLERTPTRFTSEEHLRRVIDRIVSRVGRRIDESSPLVDARLADGSRVNAIIPPLAFSGSTLTIRKFSKDPFTVDDLISFGTLSPEMAELLHACVEARLNVIVSGGTGTGKTTFHICLLWHTSSRDYRYHPGRLKLQEDHQVTALLAGNTDRLGYATFREHTYGSRDGNYRPLPAHPGC
jgi:pilus assembly protein CpaF